VAIARVWDPSSKSITERTLKLGENVGADVVVLGGVFAGDSVVVPGKKAPE
jgi:multidrug efflux pump subunit AcrA (membrane-fusion protein)